MERRQTQLPDRPSSARPERRRRRSAGRWLAVAVLLVGAGLFVAEQLAPGLERWWRDDLGPRLRGEPPLRQTEAPPGGLVVHESLATRAEILPEDVQFQPAPPETVTLSLAGFAPAGFRIPAVSHPVALRRERPVQLHSLPAGLGEEVRFGVLELGPTAYGFALAAGPDGYRLWFDRNADGALVADEMQVSEASGGFAATLQLPLAAVSGLGDGQAVYALWLYAPDGGAPFDGLRVYARTQLRGQVALGGRRYTAWLADNEHLDGDYRNDGLGIDLDDDGRIATAQEWIRPGGRLVLERRSYRFEVRR